jgi:quercetin dioxygenase-like cupin family protein
MKKNLFLAMTMTLFFFVAFDILQAQSTTMGGENVYKLMADTAYCKATHVTFMPGVKTDTHTHPAHFVYALTDGELEIHYADGKVENFQMKKGEYGLFPPERPHWTMSKGKKPMEFLLIEFPNQPYMDKKMGSMK